MKLYVYLHVDPESGKVVYVGKGTAGRAWSCGSSTAVPGKRGNRTKEHNATFRAAYFASDGTGAQRQQ